MWHYTPRLLCVSAFPLRLRVSSASSRFVLRLCVSPASLRLLYKIEVSILFAQDHFIISAQPFF